MTTVSPTMSSPGRTVVAGSAIVFVAYFVLLHILIVRDIAPALAIGLIVGPWVAGLAVALIAGGRGPTGRPVRALLVLVGIAASCGLGWLCRRQFAARVDVVLYLENLAFLAALCGVFASTLRRGREPLITRLARTARGGHLPPQAIRYTRRVTIVWAAFFATMASISTALFVTRSLVVWSTFVNLLIWPSMVALFVLEYFVRVRVLRDIPHVPLMSGVQAFRQRDGIGRVAAIGPVETRSERR